MSNMLFIVSGMFITGGLITGFGPFYIAALTCLLTGSGIALDTLCDKICELETELFTLKRDMYKAGFNRKEEEQK